MKAHKTLSVMLTHQCTASCKNCGTFSHPLNMEHLPLSVANHYINNIDMDEFKVVVFTGGEATLRFLDLVTLLKICNKKGLITRLVTNAHWANDKDSAVKIISTLSVAGLQEMNFSTGDEHAKYVPLINICNAIKYSIKYFAVSVMIEVTKENNITKNKLINALISNGMSDHELKKVGFIESPWMPVNYRDNIIYDNKNTISYSQAEISEGCNSILNTYTLNADGRITACCGIGQKTIRELTLGMCSESNLPPISTLISNAESDLIKQAVSVLGPFQLLKLGSDRKSSLDWSEKIAHKCQACSLLYHNKNIQDNLIKQLPVIKSKVINSIVIDAAIKKQIVGYLHSEKPSINHGGKF